MRKEYDFTKARKNPYAKPLKKSVTIRLDTDTVAYFKDSGGFDGAPMRAGELREVVLELEWHVGDSSLMTAPPSWKHHALGADEHGRFKGVVG